MIEVINVEQGTEEWRMARLGIPTASQFSTVLARGNGLMRKKYLYALAGEIVTGQPMLTYSNEHMERGKAMEEDARNAYAFLSLNYVIQQVGFVKNGTAGYSPDGFVGNDGLLEIKTALPHIMVEHILKNEFPSEHKAQCQGGLWVTGREWIDLVIYWPGMPVFIRRSMRDEEYISKLDTAVDKFNEELGEIVKRVESYSE